MNSFKSSENSSRSLAKISVFENAEFGSVRTTLIDGEPFFVGKDVATVLGYSNPRDALSKHVDDEDKGVAKCDTLGGAQELAVINESGLYSLILSSKLEAAKKFKRWVTSEVLPSIRKTGSYTVSAKTQQEIDNETERNRIAKANIYLELAKKYSGNEEYTQILDAYATKAIESKFVLPLPETEKTYSATEIGDMLGISANRVGKIANANGMKTAEFGKYFIDIFR